MWQSIDVGWLSCFLVHYVRTAGSEVMRGDRGWRWWRCWWWGRWHGYKGGRHVCVLCCCCTCLHFFTLFSLLSILCIFRKVLCLAKTVLLYSRCTWLVGRWFVLIFVLFAGLWHYKWRITNWKCDLITTYVRIHTYICITNMPHRMDSRPWSKERDYSSTVVLIWSVFCLVLSLPTSSRRGLFFLESWFRRGWVGSLRRL